MFRIKQVFAMFLFHLLAACGPGFVDDRGEPFNLYDDGCIASYNDHWMEFLWLCDGHANDSFYIPTLRNKGYKCEQIYEEADPSWQTSYENDVYKNTNWFCAKTVKPEGADLTLKWSQGGPVGSTCVKVFENADPHAWDDNYLCMEGTVAKALFDYTKPHWSEAGPTTKRCIRWSEPNDEHTWGDNYLCWN